MTDAHPAVWSREELQAGIAAATAAFRRERIGEPLEKYLDFYQTAREATETLLEATVDLKNLNEMAAEVLSDPELMHAARYLASPPISEDDLKTLADVSLAPTLIKKDPERAAGLMYWIMAALDRERFPWVSEQREPSDAEREIAIVASAAMRAFRQVETWRRSEGKRSQEQLLKDFLTEQCGFTEAPKHAIPNITQAPPVGHFCGEVFVGSRRADVPIRLWDGRLMPVECKVSNSTTNSYKRINNDAAVKAVEWKNELGPAHVVPAALLTGVYDLANLEYAQSKGLTLFWAHDLDPLYEFISATQLVTQ
jgi:hypothetical protein